MGRAGVARSARLLVILGSAFGIGVLARSVVPHEPEPRPPVITVADDGASVITVDTSFPAEAVDLLWLQGRTAQPATGHQRSVLGGAGNVLLFDRNLRLRQPRLHLGAQEVISAARGTDGWWVVTGESILLHLDEDGRPLGAVEGLFDFPTVVAGGQGGGVWLVRSSSLFSFNWTPEPAPLLLHVAGPADIDSLGVATVPQHVLLREMANAGHLAVRGDTLFYAPFIRDELIALTSRGDTLWRATRGLPQSTEEPKFEVQDGRPVLDYHPVNLGLTFGPDGMLYLLSTPEFTTSESRLDVFQPATGELLRTAYLNTSLPSIAVNDLGRLYQVDDFSLLSGIAVDDREPLPAFDLALLGGGRIRSDQLMGRVTLINFWASWCEPCREEMPALDTLQRSIDDPAFEFLTLNEDVDPEDAAEFMEMFGFDFPAALGRGGLKATYHYRGLPFTLLVDREGRIVQRWIGYQGPEQMDAIRTVIHAELGRDDGGAHAQHMAAQNPPHVGMHDAMAR